MKSWALDAWGSCTHKKIVAGSAVTAFWSLTSIRTRVFAGKKPILPSKKSYRRDLSNARVFNRFADIYHVHLDLAAFLCLVILRYRRQHASAAANNDANAAEEKQEKQEQEKAIVAVETESKK